MPAPRCCIRRSPQTGISGYESRRSTQRPPDTRKHTVLPVSIRLKSTEKTPACVSMWAFLQPISARIYFGKTASHRKSARFVQSRGALPQAYWMSVKAAQRRGCVKRAFCGVCFLMPGGLRRFFFCAMRGRIFSQGTASPTSRCRGGRPCPPFCAHSLWFRRGRCPHRPAGINAHSAAGHMGPALQTSALIFRRGRRPRRPVSCCAG